MGLGEAEHFNWDSAITRVDDRSDYGEPRFISYGMIGAHLHILVWTPRGSINRPISLRKANKRERMFYEETYEETQN